MQNATSNIYNFGSVVRSVCLGSDLGLTCSVFCPMQRLTVNWHLVTSIVLNFASCYCTHMVTNTDKGRDTATFEHVKCTVWLYVYIYLQKLFALQRELGMPHTNIWGVSQADKHRLVALNEILDVYLMRLSISYKVLQHTAKCRVCSSATYCQNLILAHATKSFFLS